MRYHRTFYAVSQTKLQIINLYTVPTIICGGENDTDEHTHKYLLNIRNCYELAVSIFTIDWTNSTNILFHFGI
jgi:hypothetical protein